MARINLVHAAQLMDEHEEENHVSHYTIAEDEAQKEWEQSQKQAEIDAEYDREMQRYDPNEDSWSMFDHWDWLD